MGSKVGHPVSLETRKKIGLANSISQKGKKLSEETKRKIGLANKGKGFSKKTRKKLSEAQKGKHNSLKTEFKKGHKLSKETREKISKTLTGRYIGDKNSSWKGGLSFEPYSVDWTKTLKRAIKERDRYTCQLCGEQEDLLVHHIDCDKNNSSSDNLITLCRKCHSKVHHILWTEEDLKALKEKEA